MSVDHHRGNRKPPREQAPTRGWTITEATQHTGLTYWQLRHAMRRGRIRAERIGGNALMLLDRNDVLAFAQRKGAAGSGADQCTVTGAGRHDSTRGDG